MCVDRLYQLLTAFARSQSIIGALLEVHTSNAALCVVSPADSKSSSIRGDGQRSPSVIYYESPSCNPNPNLSRCMSIRASKPTECILSETPIQVMSQGPRNLYGRDGKFRPTFKSWTEKRRFSVTLLMT